MNRSLVWSVSLHAAFALLFVLGPGPAAFEWDRVEAIPVDLVSLPAIEVPVPEPPAPEPEPVREVEPPPVQSPPQDPPPEPKPVQQTRPKPRPKRVFKRYAPPKPDPEPSLAEKIRARMDEETPVDDEAPPPEPKPASSSTPTAEVEAVDFPYAWYLNVLRTKIRSAWDPPGERMLAGRARQVLVTFRVHRDGRITDVQVDGASGTSVLDASARRAVEQGGPYPPLPPEYEGDWLDLGVRFTAAEGGA